VSNLIVEAVDSLPLENKSAIVPFRLSSAIKTNYGLADKSDIKES